MHVIQQPKHDFKYNHALKFQKFSYYFSDNQSHRSEKEERDAGLWRDLFSYWMFGLCNNFGYVVMLTAAHDIIGSLSHDDNASKVRKILRFIELYFL